MCCVERRHEESDDVARQSDPDASIDASHNDSQSCFLNNQYRYEGFILDHYNTMLQMLLLSVMTNPVFVFVL